MHNIFPLIMVLALATTASAEEPQASIKDATERLRLVLVKASEHQASLEDFAPSVSVRARYHGFANSLLAVKDLDNQDLMVERLHELLPRIASISAKELIEPHPTVTNAVIALHEVVSDSDSPSTKDYYIAHTPLMLSPDGQSTVTVHGNFKTIKGKYKPYIDLQDERVEPNSVTDTDITFDVPERLLGNREVLTFSIVAGVSFRPVELLLIRETIRDKRKLYIRSQRPLIGSIQWTSPSQDSTHQFDEVVAIPIVEATGSSRSVRESFSVDKLLELSGSEGVQSGEFESTKMVDLKWNSRVNKLSSSCQKPRTLVSWDANSVTARTLIKSTKKKSTKKQTFTLLKTLKRPSTKSDTCSTRIDLFLMPTFQSLRHKASWVEGEAKQFSVEYGKSLSLRAPNPAFFRGTMTLAYDAGPLSFDVPVRIESGEQSRVLDLPGWRVTLQNDTIDFRFLPLE